MTAASFAPAVASPVDPLLKRYEIEAICELEPTSRSSNSTPAAPIGSSDPAAAALQAQAESQRSSCGISGAFSGEENVQQSIYGQHPIHDRSQRPLHVLVAGAGPSGLTVAIELKRLPHVTFEIFEKNIDVGGTWFENRYPGAACDVASHAYQWSFESNPDWTHHFAPAEEIGSYIKEVAAKHSLYQYIRFNSQVQGAKWEEATGQWVLQVEDKSTGQIKVQRGDVFINAGGILNDWRWPDIEGLHNFRGKLVHSAAWDPSVQVTECRVGVIGSGATSIQIVPSLQPYAKSLEVFVRSPTYILPTVGFGVESSTYNETYTEAQKKHFRDYPDAYRAFRKRIEQQMNENFAASVKGSSEQDQGRKWAESKMRTALSASKELQDKLVPSWELGCRRLTPGLPYLQAVQQPNVDVEREAIKSITHNGILTVDGKLHELDILVCATGFDTSFSGRYDISGREGVTIRERWAETGPEAYFGLAVAGLPNYLTLLGPNCPIANGSLFPCIEASAKFIRKVIDKMQHSQIRTFEVKDGVQRQLNDYLQRVHKDLVWSGRCASWYKDRKSGKITAVWPGSSIHYMEAIAEPRWEDFDIEYANNGNIFAFLGDGRSQRESLKMDLAYYLD